MIKKYLPLTALLICICAPSALCAIMMPTQSPEPQKSQYTTKYRQMSKKETREKMWKYYHPGQELPPPDKSKIFVPPKKKFKRYYSSSSISSTDTATWKVSKSMGSTPLL